jgi:ribonuclease HII
VTFPSLEVETKLLERYSRVIGLDEVGRGALAVPVAIGAAVLSANSDTTIPKGLRDSKLISEAKRDEIASNTASWLQVSVGMVSANQIESVGISKALQQAALLALGDLDLAGSVILLDGSHNFLAGLVSAPVVIRTKADRDCAVVSAAALTAKVKRDGLMRELHEDFPGYDWVSNKGYSSPSHIEALRTIGPCAEHRTSWLSKILGSDQLF